MCESSCFRVTSLGGCGVTSHSGERPHTRAAERLTDCWEDVRMPSYLVVVDGQIEHECGDFAEAEKVAEEFAKEYRLNMQSHPRVEWEGHESILIVQVKAEWSLEDGVMIDGDETAYTDLV